MGRIKILCVVIILLTWAGYYFNFGIKGVLSQKTEVWGQFGDYVGGVVNPILTFITIYLLIRSIGLQRESNDSLINEIQRQEKLEEYKKFELRFFHLIASQEESFGRFTIYLRSEPSVEEGEDAEPLIFKGVTAVSYIEDNLLTLIQAKVDKSRIDEWLDSVDEDGCYFSLVRRFYIILKLIDDNTTNEAMRSEMYEVLINLTDIKIISMIAILSEFYQWDAMVYIKNSNILDKEGVREFIDMYRMNS